MNIKDNEGNNQGLMPSIEDMANIARIAAKIATEVKLWEPYIIDFIQKYALTKTNYTL